MKDGNFKSNGTGYFTQQLTGSIPPAADDELKIELISSHFRKIMEVLGLDLQDESLKDTPDRVAKMYVKEVFSGLNNKNKPNIKLFPNKYDYKEMLIEKDITLFSVCEHHFVPIIGKVHVAYYSSGTVIGLSKLNRIVQYFGRRPQLQEKLTSQVAEELMNVLNTEDVAVYIEADHLCVKSRGVNDVNSSTITSSYNGRFLDPAVKQEFLSAVK